MRNLSKIKLRLGELNTEKNNIEDALKEYSSCLEIRKYTEDP